ncbi:UvrD-helicase domain-containing protein [Aquimarina sp. M1]
MNSQSPFTIYNAAAGAGKTYTLVKTYLIALLTGEYRDAYKNILAITFTNKAVAEMKTRVLENLVGISNKEPSAKHTLLLNDIVQETELEEHIIQQKADNILKNILHNYAAFDIVTIDTFTHRIIRTFARDLGIPMNFEIEMDTESLIEESVDAVIAKVGEDDELTRTIIDFALSKLEDDKSWDITVELNKIARLLFSENDRVHLDNLSNKTALNFKAFKNELQSKIKNNKENIQKLANDFFELIKSNGIANNEFKGSYIPKYFMKLQSGDLKVNFEKTQWMQNIKQTDFYNKTLAESKKGIIDTIRPSIEQMFLETKQQILDSKLFENIIKNLIPLSVLNVINKELQSIKKERSILLISEFNKIISDAIQDQPAPFIYERLGERYRDYFIDEFQDTSELQWKNIIPLIENALTSETLSGKQGQLTIVGDAKQAIYRWRGGKAEQFMNLCLNQNPFPVEKQVLNLPKNYRSHHEIVKFNNDLFTFLSNDFSNDTHKKLYLLGNNQEYNDKKNGYVNISFITSKNVAEENEIYPEKVYEYILELKEKGYLLNEICVLTRKRKEGTVIADFLTEKGLPIISSETLLLKNDPKVRFIVNMLTWFVYPDELLAKTNVLHFITEQFSIPDTHDFLNKLVFADKKLFCEAVQSLGIDFSFSRLEVKPLYEGVEYIINSFNLAATGPAYIQFLLDVVFGYTQKHAEGMIGFLSYWKHKQDKLSIIAPEGEEAIQIMTIHKSKGLEFPCVIYPYANMDIYREIEPKTWLPVSKEDFSGFGEVFVNYNKELSNYGVRAENIVLDRQSQLELDAFNLLYVALTRAEEQLYIISKAELNSKGESNSNKFSGKLINYLKHTGAWGSQQLTYDFGKPEKPYKEIEKTDSEIKNFILKKFEGTREQCKVQIVTNSGKLWDTSQAAAIEKGNLIHELMSTIYTHKDLPKVIENAFETGKISLLGKKLLNAELEKIVNHPELSRYFSEDNEVLNERDIMSNGRLYRPDRVVIDSKRLATIIDYKTGEHNASHVNQIEEYSELLKMIGYKVHNKILVYLNEELTLKYI